MKYFDLFTGYGGFTLGIQQAIKKSECIGFSEIDSFAIQVYKKHFPNHKNYGDITKIKPKELPDFDLLTGGFPCQAFSIAGKRKGFNDTRGTLFFDIARIIKEKKPKYILLENVKGLLSHDSGETFKTILATLTELRYDLQWQVLNAKNFGVPQNRERVFIVGHIRGESRPEVFPFGKDDAIYNGQNESKARRTQAVISPTLKGANVKADNAFIVHNVYGGFKEKKVREFHKISPTIRTPQGGGHIPMIVETLKERGLEPTKKGWKSLKKAFPRIKIPEPTKKGYAVAERGDSINLSVPNSKTRRGRVGKGIAQTLDTGMQQHTIAEITERKKDSLGRNMPIHRTNKRTGIRRLTPLECERLMGLPDNWTAMGLKEKFNLKISGDEVRHYVEISDSQRYKLCGNGVVVPIVKEIIKKLIN